MAQLVSLWNFLRSKKYLITIIAFAVLIFFLDENSMLRRWKLMQEETALREEIDKYRTEYEENTRLLNELEADSGSIERIARERYLMKKSNEDIYVFKEDLKQ
ncbi:MAG: septum formation initiator family protein [Bacteroides sp.]|nr:septum formation initiator family protein [Bacteroides sp.]